ncbi:MAG: type II secretion system protein, partial [Lentisphaerota bacterium]
MSAHRHAPPPLNRAEGMTLIELLLSLVIAILIASVLYSIYFTASRATQSQKQRLDGFLPAAEALEELSRDLSCAFAPRGQEDCELSLKKPAQGEDGVPELSFCNAVFSGRDGNLHWVDMQRMAYR